MLRGLRLIPSFPVNDHLAKERKETDAPKAEALRFRRCHTPTILTGGVDDEVARSVSSEQWELIKSDYEYLTDIGKSGTKRLIRDELRKLKDEARQDVAWVRQQRQWPESRTFPPAGGRVASSSR